MQIAKVQESLARKAHYQPNTRFDDLFSLVIHPYWLRIATESVLEQHNAESPVIDSATKDAIARDIQTFVQALSAELKAGSYCPSPCKLIDIPTADGSSQQIGIPPLRDLIVQEALRMLLEPIVESHFLNCSVGFRPGRRVMDTIHLITGFGRNNIKMWWIIKGSLNDCFKRIPHQKLLGVVKQYIQDKKVLKLLSAFLATGISTKGQVVTSDQGVLQTGILASLLVNIYLHEMDKIWWKRYGVLTEQEKTRRRRQGLGNVQLVRYADTFVFLTNGDKQFALTLRAEFAEVLNALGLETSDDELVVVHMNDGIDFLGFKIQRVDSRAANKSIVLVKPTQKSIASFKEAVRSVTERATIGDDVANKIRAVNALVRSWASYYRFANVYDEFRELERFVHMRIYYWLKAKHSNLSARESIKKYVVRTYLVPSSEARHTWGVYGVKILPMTKVERTRYYIHWPAEKNPYLDYGTSLAIIADDVPLPLPEQIWRGHSRQNAYAMARLERLAQVGYQCEICAAKDGYLHAHHVVPQREKGKHTVDNLRILCEQCHVKTHSVKK